MCVFVCVCGVYVCVCVCVCPNMQMPQRMLQAVVTCM